jgi:type II secretory pathway component PulF
MLSLRQLANYAGQLSLAIKSGIPINNVLDTLTKTAPGRRLRYISRKIREEIDSGSSLEQAFRLFDRDFPDMFISLVAAGEKTGHLEQVTAQIASFYETRQRIISAMKWELLTIGMYLFMCGCLLIFVDYIIHDWNSAI